MTKKQLKEQLKIWESKYKKLEEENNLLKNILSEFRKSFEKLMGFMKK